MDANNNHEVDELRGLHGQFISMGFDEVDASNGVNVYSSLTAGTAKLVCCKDGPPKETNNERIVVSAFFGDDHPNDRLAHHDLLFPSWKKFTNALLVVKAS